MELLTAGVAGMPTGFIICGIIWAIALGFAVGNYACSLVHRLPRGRLILDKKPYCGSCGAMLQVKDLFPVVSAVLLRHRCRYCGTPFPISHTVTEILVGLLFVLAFLRYHFTEPFILTTALGVFLITLSAIEANEKLIMRRLLLCVLVLGMLLRTYTDHSLYGFFEGGLFGVLVGALLWRKQIEKVGHIYRLPVQAELMVVAGVCVGGKLFLPLLACWAALALVGFVWAKLFRAGKPLPKTAMLGFAIMLVVMYSGWII